MKAWHEGNTAVFGNPLVRPEALARSWTRSFWMMGTKWTSFQTSSPTETKSECSVIFAFAGKAYENPPVVESEGKGPMYKIISDDSSCSLASVLGVICPTYIPAKLGLVSSTRALESGVVNACRRCQYPEPRLAPASCVVPYVVDGTAETDRQIGDL